MMKYKTTINWIGVVGCSVIMIYGSLRANSEPMFYDVSNPESSEKITQMPIWKRIQALGDQRETLDYELLFAAHMKADTQTAQRLEQEPGMQQLMEIFRAQMGNTSLAVKTLLEQGLLDCYLVIQGYVPRANRWSLMLKRSNSAPDQIAWVANEDTTLQWINQEEQAWVHPEDSRKRGLSCCFWRDRAMLTQHIVLNETDSFLFKEKRQHTKSITPESVLEAYFLGPIEDVFEVKLTPAPQEECVLVELLGETEWLRIAQEIANLQAELDSPTGLELTPMPMMIEAIQVNENTFSAQPSFKKVRGKSRFLGTKKPAEETPKAPVTNPPTQAARVQTQSSRTLQTSKPKPAKPKGPLTRSQQKRQAEMQRIQKRQAYKRRVRQKEMAWQKRQRKTRRSSTATTRLSTSQKRARALAMAKAIMKGRAMKKAVA